jgi:alanyl-tRNA synthetase
VETIAGIRFSARIVEGLDPKDLRPMLDEEKRRLQSGVAAMVAVNEGRAAVAVAVTNDLAGRHDAVALVREAVAALGGKGGGGRSDMAQGGGPDGDKAANALSAIKAALAGGE